MVKKLINIMLLFVLLFDVCDAQEFLSINGHVINKHDTTAVEYANISIKDAGIGTITNSTGQFQFYIPAEYAKDTLVVSCIGYKTYKQQVLKVDKSSDLVIKLDTAMYQLGEVLVLPQDRIRLLIKNATKNLAENYPDRLHYMTGFLRELTVDNNEKRYTRLLEADISIQDRGIRTSLENIRIQVNELRKSEDLTDYDHRFDRMGKMLGKMEYERTLFGKSSLYNLFFDNPVRYHYPRQGGVYRRMFDVMLAPEAQLSLTKVIEGDDGKIYEIKCIRNDDLITVWIDANDFGVHQLDYAIMFDDFKAKQMNLYKGNINQQIRVNYQKIDNKYYLLYCENIKTNDTRRVEGEFKFGYSITTLMINEVAVNRKMFDRIRMKFSEDKDDNLFNKTLVYHPEFWKHYNMILESPLLPKAQNDLQNKEELEHQFSKNSQSK